MRLTSENGTLIFGKTAPLSVADAVSYSNKLTYHDSWFTMDAKDTSLDDKIGDANWDGAIDVCDLVYANAGVGLKDIRAIDFDGDYAVGADDLVSIRDILIG